MGARDIFLKALTRPWFWKVIKPPVLLYVSREGNWPFLLWVEFLCWILGEGFRRRKPVVWINSFFPAEFVYGMGAIPFLPELFSALVAYFGWTRGPLQLAKAKASTDLCSFYRCALGLLDYGVLPKPDLILSCSQICDGTKAFYETVSQRLGVPHLFLDIPYGKGERAKKYVKDQLRWITEEMGRLLHRGFDQERLRASVSLAVATEREMKEVAVLRRAIPSPFPGSEGMSYVAGMGFWALGTQRGLRFFKALKGRIAKRVSKGRGYLPRERFRVLWLHHVRPYYPNPILPFLKDSGVAIAYEEANLPWWPASEGEGPLDCIVGKLMANPWNGPIEGRIELVKEAIRDYRIQGVIHFSHWGCRQSTGGAMLVGREVKEMGVPYMILPGDGADPDNYSPGQTLTRLQAFVEVMEARWGSMRE